MENGVIVHPTRSLAGSLTCTRPTEVPLGYDQSGSHKFIYHQPGVYALQGTHLGHL